MTNNAHNPPRRFLLWMMHAAFGHAPAALYKLLMQGKVLLHSPLTQGRGLKMLILDPRVSWNYYHPWYKGKVLLHLPSIQEVNPRFTQVHCKACIIALYYTILLILSIYISSPLYIYLFEEKFSQFNYTYPKTLTQSGLNSTSLYTIFIISLPSGWSTFTLLQFVPLDTLTQNCPCPNTAYYRSNSTVPRDCPWDLLNVIPMLSSCSNVDWSWPEIQRFWRCQRLLEFGYTLASALMPHLQ